jgi:ATP-dependent DNA ligase
VLDGEAVVLGVDGISDFAALHSRKRDDDVRFYAFDMLAGDGDDMRRLPLSMRKANLPRLLTRRPEGIFVSTFEAKSDRTCYKRHESSVLKDWYRSIVTGPIGQVAAIIGLK